MTLPTVVFAICLADYLFFPCMFFIKEHYLKQKKKKKAFLETIHV